MSSSATVRMRQTTTTTTTTASVLVINSGYLKTPIGILKLVITVIALIAFILIAMKASYLTLKSGFMFIFLLNFMDLVVVGLMLFTSLISLITSGLLQKLTFDFVFHFVCFTLFIIGGIWAFVNASDYNVDVFKTAAVLTIVISLLHLVHGVFSYRACKTN